MCPNPQNMLVSLVRSLDGLQLNESNGQVKLSPNISTSLLLLKHCSINNSINSCGPPDEQIYPNGTYRRWVPYFEWLGSCTYATVESKHEQVCHCTILKYQV